MAAPLDDDDYDEDPDADAHAHAHADTDDRDCGGDPWRHRTGLLLLVVATLGSRS